MSGVFIGNRRSEGHKTSDEYWLHLCPLYELPHVFIGSRMFEALRGSENVREDINIAGRDHVDALAPESPMESKVDFARVFQGLVPGGGCVLPLHPGAVGERFYGLDGHAALP